MMSIFDIGDNLMDFLSGGRSSSRDYEKEISRASEDYKTSMNDISNTYNTDVANAMKLQKSTKELYNEGKEQASAAASNKAGLAKRNAKAATMQTNGSKLMAAIQGAQSATDAATQGYDESAQSAAGMAQAQNQAQINQALNAASNKANLAQQAASTKYDAAKSAAQLKAQNAADERNSRRQMLGQIGSAAIGSLFS